MESYEAMLELLGFRPSGAFEIAVWVIDLRGNSGRIRHVKRLGWHLFLLAAESGSPKFSQLSNFLNS